MRWGRGHSPTAVRPPQPAAARRLAADGSEHALPFWLSGMPRCPSALRAPPPLLGGAGSRVSLGSTLAQAGVSAALALHPSLPQLPHWLASCSGHGGGLLRPPGLTAPRRATCFQRPRLWVRPAASPPRMHFPERFQTFAFESSINACPFCALLVHPSQASCPRRHSEGVIDFSALPPSLPHRTPPPPCTPCLYTLPQPAGQPHPTCAAAHIGRKPTLSA